MTDSLRGGINIERKFMETQHHEKLSEQERRILDLANEVLQYRSTINDQHYEQLTEWGNTLADIADKIYAARISIVSSV
jgi:recombinational DNA repair ATPase RecF